MTSSLETSRRNGGDWNHRVHISWGPKGRVIFDLTSEQLSTLQKAAKGGRGNVYRAFQRLDLERYYQALGDDGRDELVALLSRG